MSCSTSWAAATPPEVKVLRQNHSARWHIVDFSSRWRRADYKDLQPDNKMLVCANTDRLSSLSIPSLKQVTSWMCLHLTVADKISSLIFKKLNKRNKYLFLSGPVDTLPYHWEPSPGQSKWDCIKNRLLWLDRDVICDWNRFTFQSHRSQ